MNGQKADVFPLRLYDVEKEFIDYLSRKFNKSKSEVVREIIRQYRMEAQEQDFYEAVTNDGRFKIIIRARTGPIEVTKEPEQPPKKRK